MHTNNWGCLKWCFTLLIYYRPVINAIHWIKQKQTLSSAPFNANLILFRPLRLCFLWRCRELWSCLSGNLLPLRESGRSGAVQFAGVTDCLDFLTLCLP